jgi:hypothetical protein
MAALKCPTCGESGEVSRRHRGFEPRGTWQDTGKPIYRCINCGCGIIVSTWLLGWGTRVEQIDADAWGRMEHRWGRENPLPQTETRAAPSAEELIHQLRGTTPSLDHLAHLIAEATELPDARVRELIASTRPGRPEPEPT